jgi:hypothetical protein
MKSKLYLFFFMYSIWCLINFLATVIMPVKYQPPGDYFYSFHLASFYVAFILCALAVISARYFCYTIVLISLVMFCHLIFGLMEGDIMDYNVLIPLENIGNSLFVHNQFLLMYNFGLFFMRIQIGRDLSFMMSSMIIISLSAFLMIIIRNISVRLLERWVGNYDELNIRLY